MVITSEDWGYCLGEATFRGEGIEPHFSLYTHLYTLGSNRGFHYKEKKNNKAL